MNKTIDLNKVEVLCKETNSLIKHYDEIKKLNGEDFNVYSLLGLEYAENKTHSNFIAELLNPYGTHRMGATFLKLFLKRLRNIEMDVESCFVTTEKFIGPVDLSNKTGGRIDIYIEDKNGQSISVENKIYAGDQKAQIERYCNYNRPKNVVFYLTLEGVDASGESKGDLSEEEDYFMISYKNDILEWLKDCQKEAVELEKVRSGIGHYIQLIKKMTNQSSNNQMNERIKEIIKNNYEASRLLVDNIEEVEKQEVFTLMNEVKSILESKLDNWEIEIEDLFGSYSGLNVRPLFKTFDAFIRIEGQPKIWRNNSVIGIISNKNIDNPKLPVPSEWGFFEGSYRSNGLWIAYRHFLGWSNPNERAKLFDIQERSNNLNYIIDNVVELTKEFEK